MDPSNQDGRPDSRRPAMRRAAIAVLVAGPVGVLVGLLTVLPMLPVAAVFAVAASFAGALTCPDDPAEDAAVLAILPIGSWLVGAAVGWAMLAMLADAYPVLDEYSVIMTLVFSILGGTLSVVVVVTHFPRRAARK